MDNSSHKWEKVLVEAPTASKTPLRNWVRGTKRWWNLDKFVSLKVETNWNPCYDDSNNPQEWAIVGTALDNKEFFLKNYKKKENAYAWLGRIIGEVVDGR